MAACESSNASDNIHFWPSVLHAFEKVGKLEQKMHGAEGLQHTCQLIQDCGAKGNTIHNAHLVMNML